MFEFHWATLVLMGLACWFVGAWMGASLGGGGNEDPF
ncbi:hypothetical protein tf_05 [Pseudomonas phage tf]|jgi:hypothetical protein|uniref:Uncharacterized protein n=1 Tax=Pseudomonas phage tf TaxID=1114179 RepID=I2FLM6_9CAUD|nr:hypothetical protein tf_05 [Pseudomonas phage tf]CCE60760.1 hypothetical protein tf_05 [Pseudomonas phage tf]